MTKDETLTMQIEILRDEKILMLKLKKHKDDNYIDVKRD